MRGVEPVADERLPAAGLALRDLVLVMGEDVVDTARVDIECLAEILEAHGRALDVPSRPAGPEGAVPVRLVFLPCLPQNKIAGRLLLVFVGVDPRTIEQLAPLDSRQTTVIRECPYPEVERSLAHIGDALVPERFDHADHLGDVVRCARIELGSLHAQDIKSLEERPYVGFRVFGQGHALLLALADRLVIHVGEVHHLGDLVAAELQRPAQQVLPDERPEIADVGVVMDCRPAGVHPHPVGLQRDEILDALAQRVVQTDHDDAATAYFWMANSAEDETSNTAALSFSATLSFTWTVSLHSPAGHLASASEEIV